MQCDWSLEKNSFNFSDQDSARSKSKYLAYIQRKSTFMFSAFVAFSLLYFNIF